MKYLFKGAALNSNSCNDSLTSRFISPRVVQLVWFSILSAKSFRNSKKVDKNSDRNNPGELRGLGPLFDEILDILGTEDIELGKNASRRFLLSEETQLKGNSGRGETSLFQGQGVCGNAEEKRNDIKIENSLRLEDNGERVLDETEVKDASTVVHKVTEIVRRENAVIPVEESLDNADFNYNEEVVESVLKRCFKVPHLALRFFNWVKFCKGFQHTTNTFNTMINIAGEAKDIGLVEKLAEEMEKNSCEKNVKTRTILMSHYGKTKLVGKALLVFEDMKKAGVERDPIAHRIMLRALCNAGKADLALEFYKDMVHNEVNLDVGLYKQLLKCFALSGDAAAVHLVGENMIRFSEIPEPDIYSLMLKSFCVAGRIRESLELIRDMKSKNVSLDTSIFETLVKGLCSKDRITDALEILEIMKKKNEFDRDIYGILISTYLRRNEVSEAFNLFRLAKQYGNISVSTYTNLMQHLFRNNEFQKGLDLYNEMLDLGIQLDSVAITAVAAGYVQQNCISEACKVFKSMDEKGIKPTSKSYTIFIKELCKVCKTDEIVNILNDMQICPSNIRDYVFRQVLSYLEKKGQMEKMNAILGTQGVFTFHPGDREEQNTDQCNRVELIEESEMSPERCLSCFPESDTIFNANNGIQEVRQILLSSNDWCFIQEKLEKLECQFTPDLVVGILQNCAPNIGTALKFFSWIGEQTGYSHTEKSYHMAMKIAGQGKNFKQMRSLFYEMRRKGFSITSDTWTIMIQQYGRTRLTDIALSIFREMKLSGCKPSKSTYNSLITSLCGKKGRKVDEAIQIYQEMIRVGCDPDKELIETYIGCLCEVNKLSDARSCIESLNEFGFSIPLSYSLYFRALCRAGKLEEALMLMDEIGSGRNVLDQYTYGSLIHGLLRRGQLEEALTKMKCMKEVGINPTVHVYTALIIHFLKEKDINRAMETLEEMKEQGCQPSIVTYSALICGYVRLALVSDAWSVFHHLKKSGPSPDFRTYSMFIDCLCRIGKSEEAFKLISEMLQDGIIPSTINFQKIIYGLNREGKPNLAQVVLRKKLDLKRRRKQI